MDLADVIEGIRKLKRQLYSSGIGFSASELFDSASLDQASLSGLRDAILEKTRPVETESPAVTSVLDAVSAIIEALKQPPVVPSEDALCERFSAGSLDPRTVVQITGWTLDELYDACRSRGLPVPSNI